MSPRRHETISIVISGEDEEEEVYFYVYEVRTCTLQTHASIGFAIMSFATSLDYLTFINQSINFRRLEKINILTFARGWFNFLTNISALIV